MRFGKKSYDSEWAPQATKSNKWRDQTAVMCGNTA